MPAKKPAPKSAKGKKAPSRPAAKKAAARKPEPARAKPAVAAARKAAAPAAVAPKKVAASTPAAASEPAAPPKKPARTSVGVVAAMVPSANRAASAPVVGDGEDTEGGELGSLLAGPRNVQPYIAKRGEQYMSKEQLGHFSAILNNWKRDLMVEVDRTVTHMKDEAANFPDPNDRATQEEEFSLELRTRDRERKLIRKIDEALKRIEDGSYGYCLETGEEIGIKRLEARPVATLSLEAQERRERRERQYGDRDDRYR
ncbi:MAG: RNA polymerase-binding protein DksA [Proteobacteria bacterium]|nr:RNA polymerase-binding protein DksA [Pseudomonadota bacterium]